MTKLAILGASGHGKVLAEIAWLQGWQQIDFFDDRFPELMNVEHWPVLGNTEQLLQVSTEYDGVIVGIGNNSIRLTKQQQLTAIHAPLVSLIHPTAVVSDLSSIGVGSVVLANAVINPFSKVGKACIINTAATVDHDCLLSDGVHISPGAHLAGGVIIGKASWVGIGACVLQFVEIGDQAVIGAGAVVTRSISSFQKVIGSPAKPI